MSKLTVEKRQEFLNYLSEGFSVTIAARGIGVTRQAIYKLRKNDTVFAEAFDGAVEEGTDLLEDEAMTRAMDGSDTMLIFMLKARRPDKYRENRRIGVTAKVGEGEYEQKDKPAPETPVDPTRPGELHVTIAIGDKEYDPSDV